jgi:hypothetical protein
MVLGESDHGASFSSLFSSDLLKYQEKLYNKHKDQFKRIFTTCGEITSLKLKIRRFANFAKPVIEQMLPNTRLKQVIKNEIAKWL